jgi:hypothetical protein
VSQGENSRERERKRGILIELPPVGKKKKGDARIRKRREEGQMEFPKGLYAISENCKGLSVKHNFSSI